MSIEHSDVQMFLRFRESNPEGTSCAILGDVSLHSLSGMDEFKNLLGFDIVHTFDINGNPTHKINLNDPVPEELCSQYDWVIDSGTLYCCFNISTVWKNILSLLKESGAVVHTAGLSGFYGRGFYSLSPSLFRDFYNANNFEILGMGTKTRRVNQWYDFDPNNTYLSDANSIFMKFQEHSGSFIEFIPNDCMIYCFAKRDKSIDFVEPVPQHFIDTDGA